jgi:multiphosphoryl transfer protein
MGAEIKIVLMAPMSGQLVPIETIPDPVFAQKMVGDGVSIDPLEECLYSPCDGEVIQIHSAGHAVTVATAGGIEVLMHIGLDTVNLKGNGFRPKVKTGDRVTTGTELIEFDADYIATHAKSLLTQIIITTVDKVAEFKPASGNVRAGKDPILELTLSSEDGLKAETEKNGKPVVSEAIIIPNATGLHARPAAVLANAAKKFKADIRLQKGEQQANAKSTVSIMSLEVEQGDKVVLIGKGTDADEAIKTLKPMLEAGLGDEGYAPAPAPATTTALDIATPILRPVSSDPNLLLGVSASPGLAVGNIFQVRREEIVIQEDAADPHREQRLLEDAIEKAKNQLEALQSELRKSADPSKAAIFAAHQELLEDPDLIDIVRSGIAKGKSAAFAWQQAVKIHADRLSGLKNELLAARANDVSDVGGRVLQCLTGTEAVAPVLPPNSILIAEDLTPSETANLDRERVVGFCTTLGGATSHVAILARSLDIPAIAGIEPKALELRTGTPVILDGGKGSLRLNPSPAEMEQIRGRKEKEEIRRKANLEKALEPAITTDGHRVEVVANIGAAADARKLLTLGGEGVGLLRTEFLFMERTTAPSEDEQFENYKVIAKELGKDRPLVIRTLDVGGDKPLAYLPIPKEENPFLGERGIRVGLAKPRLLRTQLRAILRASEFGKVLVMFPMIGTMPELREAKAIFNEECGRLGVEPIPVGIMVEIPATAVMAEQFAKEADFFSIGTNDLTQYTLAMDRGHPKLAPKVDALNPGVLQLIALTVKGAHAHGKWVGVCGGIASDPVAVPILIGLGVDELSVSIPAIPAIKAQIRSSSLSACQELARQALTLDSAADVRELCSEAIGLD